MDAAQLKGGVGWAGVVVVVVRVDQRTNLEDAGEVKKEEECKQEMWWPKTRLRLCGESMKERAGSKRKRWGASESEAGREAGRQRPAPVSFLPVGGSRNLFGSRLADVSGLWLAAAWPAWSQWHF